VGLTQFSGAFSTCQTVSMDASQPADLQRYDHDERQQRRSDNLLKTRILWAGEDRCTHRDSGERRRSADAEGGRMERPVRHLSDSQHKQLHDRVTNPCVNFQPVQP